MRARSILIYGGTSKLLDGLAVDHDLEIQLYEIGNGIALPREFVVSVNKLQEVGMLGIDNALDDLKRVTSGVGFFHVGIPDGIQEIETSKTIIQSDEWWLDKFIKRFDLQTFQRIPGGFYVIVYKKPEKIIH